jgi:hypothetical protein
VHVHEKGAEMEVVGFMRLVCMSMVGYPCMVGLHLYQTLGGEICTVAGDELMKDYQRVTLYSDNISNETDMFSGIL